MVKIKKKPAAKLARSKKELVRKKKSRVGLSVRIKKIRGKAKPVRGQANKQKIIFTNKAAVPDTKPNVGVEEAALMAAKLERQKRYIMWSGVTFFMVLIAFFWLYNTKQVLEKSKLDGNEASFSLSDWQSITEKIGGQVDQIKEGVKDMKTDIATSADSQSEQQPETLPLSGSTADTPAINTGKNTADINALQKRLEALENNK